MVQKTWNGLWSVPDLSWPRALVRHRVNNQIHSQPISREPELQRVTRFVNPFPCVAVVSVARDENHYAARLVDYPLVMWDISAFFVCYPAVNIVDIGNLNDFVNVEIAVEDRMIERQFLYRIFWKDLAHLLLHVLPFVFAPEIVEHEKTSARQEFAQVRRVFSRELHKAGLDGVSERVLEEFFVAWRHGNRVVGNRQAAPAPFAQAHDKMLVGLRIIGRPHSAPPVRTIFEAHERVFQFPMGIAGISPKPEIGPLRQPLALRG